MYVVMNPTPTVFFAIMLLALTLEKIKLCLNDTSYVIF